MRLSGQLLHRHALCMTSEVRFALGVIALIASAGGPIALFALWMYRQPSDTRGYVRKWEHHRSRSAKFNLIVIAAAVCLALFSWGLAAVKGAL